MGGLGHLSPGRKWHDSPWPVVAAGNQCFSSRQSPAPGLQIYAKGDGTLAKDTKQASLWYRKAAESDSSDILNNVAWALATSEDPAIQDPAAALAYAQKAVNAEHGNPRAFILDTLAQAYYVNKQYENAFNTERKAIQVAGPEEKEKYNTQMEVYRLAVADQKLPKPRKRT